MFCKTDEEIQRNAGKTYQDVTALRDPLVGLGLENDLEETPVSFEGTAQDAASFFTDKKTDYIQLENGLMNGSRPSGEKSLKAGKKRGKIGKTKYAPSPQRNHGGIQLSPKTYSRLTGVVNTRYPNLPEGAVRQIRDANRRYTIKADGSGSMIILEVKKIK